MVLIIMAKRKRPPRPPKDRGFRGGRAHGRRGPRRHPGPAGSPADSQPGAVRGPSGTVWIYGYHPVLAALANPRRTCFRLLIAASAERDPGHRVAEAGRAVPGRPDPETVERAEIDRIVGPGSVHQGLALLAGPLPDVAIEDVVAGAADTPDSAVVVLDQATDPQNVGAVLRSAAAFGAAAVVIQDRHGPPMSSALLKAASGAAEKVPLVRVVNLARAIWALKDGGFWCVGLDPAAGRTLAAADLKGRAALVLGAEGRGLRRLTAETCDELLKVPIVAGADSLNLSNAAAVALYELNRKRG